MNKKLTLEVSDNEMVVTTILCSSEGYTMGVLNPKDADVMDKLLTFLHDILDEKRS